MLSVSLSSEQHLDMNVVFQNWMDLGKVRLFHFVSAWRGCTMGLDLHECWYQGRMNAALHLWPQSSADLRNRFELVFESQTSLSHLHGTHKQDTGKVNFGILGKPFLQTLFTGPAYALEWPHRGLSLSSLPSALLSWGLLLWS